jgi:hypothetical protein
VRRRRPLRELEEELWWEATRLANRTKDPPVFAPNQPQRRRSDIDILSATDRVVNRADPSETPNSNRRSRLTNRCRDLLNQGIGIESRSRTGAGFV